MNLALITVMQSLKPREIAPDTRHGESMRLFPDRLYAGQNSRRQWIGVFLVILLLHATLIAYLWRPPEPETPAKPFVMDIALIAPPTPQPAKPAPPAPPVVAKPKPQPAPVKPKKAPALPKKTPVVKKTVNKPTPAQTPEPAPAEKPVTQAPATPQIAAPPKPAAAPPAPPPPKTETFTEANYQAQYKSNPKPEYPRLAKSRGWQGKVLLRVQVSADGHATSVQVQQSSGHEMLDEAAIEAVKDWIFTPAKRGDTPVPDTVTVPINFHFEN